MGPVEYLVIKFEGNKFTGEIAPELQDLRDKGIVRVLDLVFVRKDASGSLHVTEATDLEGKERKKFTSMAHDMVPMLSTSDIETIAHDMPNNSSLAMLLFEHTWATKLKDKMQKAGGEVVYDGRVPAEVVQQVVSELSPERRAA